MKQAHNTWGNRFPNKLGDLAAEKRQSALTEEMKLLQARMDARELLEFLDGLAALRSRVERLAVRYQVEPLRVSIARMVDVVSNMIAEAKR